MKSTLSIYAILLSFFCSVTLLAQTPKVYHFSTKANVAKVKLNNDPGDLPFDQIPNPFEFGIPKGSTFAFILPNDSLNIKMEEDIAIHIFREELKDTLKITLKSVVVTSFDEAFKKKNNGKINIEIPEVYELMNVLIALTPTGISDKSLVYQESNYYQEVQAYFKPYQSHTVIKMVDALLKQDKYYPIKMDSYCFRFDKNHQLVEDKNYHVISWDGINALSPELITHMNDFVQKSNFRRFYAQHKSLYTEQVNFFRKEVNLSQMIRWLQKNFPTKHYDYFNVLFSPLVYGNQSTNNFEDNHFTEAQVHINFPYILPERQKQMPKSYSLYRGNIVFTELNHNFINPEAEKYAKEIKGFMTDLTLWEEKNKAAQYGYPTAMSCFEEYLNWGLVSLYLYDHADKAEYPTMVANLDTFMQENRGFKQFKSFNHFLIDLYKNKQTNTTVADLYPTIVNWFKVNNR